MADQDDAKTDDDSWLVMARDAYTQSTDWFDVSLRPQIEKAMAHFNNKHGPGSKYHTETYKLRSRGFRPKTRATIRRNEAAAAMAFFSTQDMVTVAAENEADQVQLVSARVISELLNYRLDDSIPWFQTLLGGYQDALNTGMVISHQSWEYEEDTGIVLTDKPRVDLVAIENFRLSPAANWTDPVGTSPYLIEMIPMPIGDVKQKMDDGKWKAFDDGAILAAAASQYDSVRAARDGTKRADSADVKYATTDFDTVFVHRNVIHKDREDWVYFTLGTHHRLSEPKRLTEEYRHLRRGERPYVVGNCIIEAHKAYAVGLNELTFGLQEDANEIRNQRNDNIRLVLNKRYFSRRGANIDYKSLTMNVPGSVTRMDDINTDVRWDSPPDVTASSYQEQDRISLDYDELAGTFSPGSVQSNRKLGETVGGMEMLSGDANVITEYQLRVFSETWVEPVLKQLVRLEQAYETDARVLAIAGQKAKIERMGIDTVTDDLLQGMVTVRVNAGFGATNPKQRVEKLAMGLGAIGQFLPQLIQGLDGKEVVTEIFGALGFKGAERFFPHLGDEQEDPQVMQLKQMVQQLQQMLQGKQAEQQARIEIENIRQQGETQRTAAKLAFENEQGDLDRRMEQLKLQIEATIKAAELDGTRAMNAEDSKAAIAQTTAKLLTMIKLAMHREGSPQALSAPTEPPGRADNGKAFQQ